MAARQFDGVADDPRDRVAAVVAQHEPVLLRAARQASLCQDDALDAYQRALEIFLRRVESVDPATEVAWLKVVVRHEALAIRRARSESITGEEVDLDGIVPSGERSVDERVASEERVRRSAEALRSLKPDEARALMLKAHGLSYEEIGRRNGWTYTKVNRSITEGRRRFMEAYAEIETGAECERFAPVVSALADGSASSAQVLAIRPHLRHCTSCRAAVRDLHLSRSRRALLFFPLFAVGGSPEPPAMHEVLEVDPADLPEPSRGPAGWLVEAKDTVVAFFHRLGGSDLATSVHIASATGGSGRVATLAAVIGFCVSSVGAGTVCVVAGLVPNPLEDARPDAREQRAERPRREPIPITAGPSTPAPRPLAVEQAELVAVSAATPTPTPMPARARRKASSGEAKEVRRTPTPLEDPAQGTTPTSQESAPISPAPPASTTGAASGQDTFTPEAPRAPVEPAAAPATGGGEFTP